MRISRLPGRSVLRALAAGLAVLALTACADLPPVQLAASYAPTTTAPSHPLAAGRAPCRVFLAGVQDLRDDPQAAGLIADRFVHAEDAPAWLRSGVLSISRDGRLEVSDAPPANPADLTIRIELLKVYIIPINEAKSANVVIRVHFAGPGDAPDDQVYRGTFTSLNWASSADEARGALDIALSRVLASVDRDLASRCARTTNVAGR